MHTNGKIYLDEMFFIQRACVTFYTANNTQFSDTGAQIRQKRKQNENEIEACQSVKYVLPFFTFKQLKSRKL